MTTILLLLAWSVRVPTPQPVPAPEVDAKQLAVWVAELSHPDFARQNAAVAALVKAGPKALPVLPELIKLIESKNPQVVWSTIHAINVVAAIGPDARDAIPGLLAHLKPTFGGSQLDYVAVALAKIDKPRAEATTTLLQSSNKGTPILLVQSAYIQAYPVAVAGHLLALCEDKDAEVRRKAILVLAGLPASSYDAGLKPLVHHSKDLTKDALQTFQKLFADGDPVVRLTAAHGYSRVAPEQAAKTIPTVVATMSEPKFKDTVRDYPTVSIFQPVPQEAARALIELFDGTDPGRSWAINTLAELPAVPLVEATLHDGKTARIREAAALSLGHRFNRGVSSLPVLKAALGDREFVVRFAAALALVQIGGRTNATAATGVPVLIEGLKHEDATVRLMAAEQLLVVGTRARAAIPELKLLLADAKPAVALEAALALAEIARAEVTEAIPVLVDGLRNDKEPSVLRATRALGVFGPHARSAIPELVKHFDAKMPELKVATAEAVARIDPDQTEKAVDVLVAVLKRYHSGSSYHVAALNALASIGPAAKSALPALVAAFQGIKKGNDYLRLELALAVLAIDAETAKPVVELIRERVTKGGEDDDELAMQFRRLGVRSKPLLAELILMLGAKNPYVRECAAVTLGAIGPDARDALPRLKELTAKNDGTQISKLATDAIKKIETK